MFYSHELLHSREYGVATIWLVATLGSKSNLKKVTRKAILDVDIPKACTTITDPEAPLALRLQASLLYGVSRVHSQQCNYVLTDIQSFRDKMRGMARVMQELEIDPEVGRTRPEHLNLLEDAAFIPELDLMFDLSAFDLPSDSASSCPSSVVSRLSEDSSHTSRDLNEEDQEEELALDIPSIDPPSRFGEFQLAVGSSVGGLSFAESEQLSLQHEESPIISDPDFDIAEDGSLVAPANVKRRDGPFADPTSETGLGARVGAPHEAVMEAQQTVPLDVDNGIIISGDDDDSRLPSAEPFPPAVPRDIIPSSVPPAPSSPRMPPPETSASNELAAAPQRAARASRRAQMDQRTELQNKDLGDWSNNYLDNMARLVRTKEQHRSTAQAKKNAAFWILGQGIGGVQANFGDDREIHPLSVFSGPELLDALIGPQAQGSPTGSKRARSDSAEMEEGRRVRPRDADVQDNMVRGAGDEQLVLGLEGGDIIVHADDFNPESEVGRRGGSSIQDAASILPWNRSSARNSRYGSGQYFTGSGPAQGASSSAVGRVGGFRGVGVTSSSIPRGRQGSILGNVRSRMLSASPLVGKGHGRLPSMDLEDLMEMADRQRLDMPGPESGLTRGAADDAQATMDIDDITSTEGNDLKHYGPASANSQTSQTSHWMRKALEYEALNFLRFLETVLSSEDVEGGSGIDEHSIQHREKRDEISMDELLPPAENSAVVGAQALLHVLALVTKGFMCVKQDEPFGEILLSVVNSRARAGTNPYASQNDIAFDLQQGEAENSRDDFGGVERGTDAVDMADMADISDDSQEEAEAEAEAGSEAGEEEEAAEEEA